MSRLSIRREGPGDIDAVDAVLAAAFGGRAEADLVAALRDAGDVVLSLVAERDGRIVGHILFSRLTVAGSDGSFAAVALAPLAVDPRCWKSGIGTALVEAAHVALRECEEALSIVLGEPAYYGRFGYVHERAAGFGSAYQCDALQALAWGDAPRTGRLDYAPAFASLG